MYPQAKQPSRSGYSIDGRDITKQVTGAQIPKGNLSTRQCVERHPYASRHNQIDVVGVIVVRYDLMIGAGN